jgi:two-component system OmpR family response regulator
MVLTRHQILRDVWGEPSEITTRSTDNFVMRLRRMIEPDPAQPRYILSVRGTGYRFVAKPDPDPTGDLPESDSGG